MELTSESWFRWAIGLVIALPLVLITLTEVLGWLGRRGSKLAGPVAVLRNFVVPAGALLVLLTKVWELDDDATWVRILATAFGFLLILLVLAALNVVLFQQAARGTWRERMPSIFVDIVRLVLVVIGLALLFSWVWGANVGGLFAALGVTSIVLGFALQNAVGSIISGLLLLFEQPFGLGDWLDTSTAKGRVVEVNWRAVHIETADGVHVVPNATLAEASFANLSRPPGRHNVTVDSTFAAEDRPDAVVAMLDRSALDIPVVGSDARVSTSMVGPHAYATTIAVRSPADGEAVASTFRRWIWYSARRAGFHLDGATDRFSDRSSVVEILSELGPSLHLKDTEVDEAATGAFVERWGAGERMQREGEVPDALRFVTRGGVLLDMTTPHGEVVPLDELPVGQILGLAGLTRQRLLVGAVATEELEVLVIPIPLVERLMRGNTLLARDLGRANDLRIQSILTRRDAVLHGGPPVDVGSSR